MDKLVIGGGYLGLRVARRWLAAGEKVAVVTRSPLRASELRSDGFVAVVADVTDAASLVALPPSPCVLYAVGFDRNAGPSMEEVYVGGLQRVLDTLGACTRRLVYISSTGVYGQQDSAEVDEMSPCRPQRQGGRICLQAEETLRAHALGGRSTVLRLAGIYGPGRIPRQDDILAGRRVASPATGEMNLIHVEDAVDIAMYAAAEVDPPELFCVADGHPVERREFYRHLARLLGAAEPTFVEPPADSHAAGRAASSKRINSSKLLARLGRPLKYPTYRDGLAAIIGGDR